MANRLMPRLSTLALKRVDSLLGRLAANLLPPAVSRPLPAKLVSILIIRPGGIGDAALLAPMVAVLLDHYPEATLTVLAERRNAGLFRLIPGIHQLLLYDRPADLFEVMRSSYDLLIDTEQWHRLSAVVARLIGASFSIGFATNERSRLFTASVPYSHADYEPQSFLNLLKPLGILANYIPGQIFLTIPVNAAEEVRSLGFCLLTNSYVTIFPGASISERRWGTDKFKQLAALLGRNGYTIVVVGGESEYLAGEEIVAEGGFNFAGKVSLAGSAYLMSHSRLLITGDSGVLHIATGLNVQTLSLFGPSNVVKWAPLGSNHVSVTKHHKCSPCSQFGYTPACSEQVCCLSDISVDDVCRAATALLNNSSISANIPLSIAGQGG